MPLGPYGLDDYGVGVEHFPHALRNFSARPGMQGPQVILSWDAPSREIGGIEIRRKLGEYPVDLEDGTLVLRELEDPMGTTSCVDVDERLLPDAEPGDSRWWYYRAFVYPLHPSLSSQLDGTGSGTLTVVGSTSDALFVDGVNTTIYLQHKAGAMAVVGIQVAPTSDGPWITRYIKMLNSGESDTQEITEPHRYIRVKSVAGGDFVYWACPATRYSWVTSESLIAPVLVFKSGKHLAAALEGGLPHVYLDYDLDTTAPVQEASGEDGEVFNLMADGTGQGHLWKFLNIYLAEFDRVDAYLRAIHKYLPDLSEMPPHTFAHVAQMLGYPLEEGGRNLESVRQEIARVAGVWKAKGTSQLILATCRHIFGIVPRVQEGAGRVFRVADPDLYDRIYAGNDSIGD